MTDYNFRIRSTDAGSGATADRDYTISVGSTRDDRLMAVDATDAYSALSASAFTQRTGQGSPMAVAAPTGRPVANGSGLWLVSLGTSGAYKTSPDGITWTSRTVGLTGVTSYSGRFFYLKNRFLTMARPTSSTSGQLAQSFDGVTWTKVGGVSNTYTTDGGQHISYGDGRYFISSFLNASTVAGWTVTDLSAVPSPVTTATMPGWTGNAAIASSVYVNGNFYLVDRVSPRVLIGNASLRGCTPVTVTATLPGACTLDGIFYLNGVLLITTRRAATTAGSLDTVYRSTDGGLSWTARTFAPLYATASTGVQYVHMHCVTYNGQFIIASDDSTGNGSGPLRVSSDGLNWSAVSPSGFPATVRGLARMPTA